jgi:hypothetical protein
MEVDEDDLELVLEYVALNDTHGGCNVPDDVNNAAQRLEDEVFEDE